MFGNPFGSFHDMVADAKDEREQLDRLLTISTPRERLLVAVVAVFVLVLAGWLLFGSVARSVTLDGMLVEPTEGSAEADRTVQAIVWVPRGVASDIEPGMPAVIEPAVPDGAGGALAGEVATITAILLGRYLLGRHIPGRRIPVAGSRGVRVRGAGVGVPRRDHPR